MPGASINDVALAWIGGALRGYLGEHGELPESSLVALMPISLRATTTQPHGGTEVSASRGGNRFAMANIPMGTDVEDPLERVAAVQTRTQTAKEYALDARAWSSGRRPCPARWPARLSGRSSGWPIARAARWACTDRHARAGPRNPLYFDGARCLFTSGMAPVVDGMGIIHAVTSYQEQFVACFTADRDMTPDPAFYASRLDAAFGDLKKSAGIT